MPPQGRPGFSFLICPDSLLLKRRLEAQTAEFFPSGSQWERHVHWGDEEPTKSFWDQLTLRGMFGKPRAVIVRQAQQWSALVWKQLSKALGRPSSPCIPFFCLEMSFDKGKPKIPAYIAKLPCFNFAERQGWVWSQDGLNARGLKSHVQLRAKELKLHFQPDALDQFCACLPLDASVIESELQKLLLLSRAGDSGGMAGVIKADMMNLCAANAECNIFSLIKYVQSGNLPAVLREMARNRGNEDLFFRLLTLLARDIRTLWRLKAGEKLALFPAEAEVKNRLAGKMNFAALTGCMSLLVEAEWQVKSGRCEVEQSLDFLLAELSGIFKRIVEAR